MFMRDAPPLRDIAAAGPGSNRHESRAGGGNGAAFAVRGGAEVKELRFRRRRRAGSPS